MKKKILIIDDTETFLYILNHILREDYITMISKSGEDGLEVAKEQKPDLIVLDVMMPGMSGYEVLAALKSDPEMKSIPVILATGNNTADDETQGYALGAIDYIKKPFVKSAVKERVAAALATAIN